MNFAEYLKENKIQFNQVSETTFNIDGKRYSVVEPKDGVFFDKDFKFVHEQNAVDRYAYKFGGNWYWENVGDEKSPKMNELKYLGQTSAVLTNYTFLGVRGGYEILNGSRLYDDWVRKAKFLGITQLGICEKNTLAGVLKFQLACEKEGIKPCIGGTYTIYSVRDDLKYDVKLYVTNELGWQEILEMNKEANVINNKFVPEERFKQIVHQCVIIVDPKSLKYSEIGRLVFDYYQLDPVEFVSNETDKEYLNNLRLFVRSKLEPISITDAFYLDEEHAGIKKLLNAISGVGEYESTKQYFKDKDDYLAELEYLFNVNDDSIYRLFQKALDNEYNLAKSCDFKISIGKRFLPKYEMTDEEKSKFKTNIDLFWHLLDDGFARKVKGYDKKYLDRLEKEFDVIEKGDVIDYFLILWDIIKFARENGILVGVGRGSAGGSIISYFLDIIQLDPLEFDLLFERFLNEGRIKKSLPDIDTDFPSNKREIIKKYMEERYGIDQVCSVGTYTALQVKSSIKDLSRQFNVGFADVNMVTKYMPNTKKFNELFEYAVKDSRTKSFVKKHTEVINNIPLLLHQPKAKSIHACAMLILPKEKTMFEWLPVSNIDGQMVSEWEGPELEAAGFLKEDILGVTQLDKFEKTIDLIKQHSGDEVNIYDVPLNDREVYKYFKNGWNGDIFHFGSRGLTQYCKQLLPENIEDLIAGISLYRPGAMENNFHNEYVLRKEGKREIEYFTGSEKLLNKTYGVFVYQEQIMALCQVLGGLSLVEADDVRKAMVKKKYEELTKYKERFIPYYIENFGVTQEYSENVWEAIDKASTYLFNRSHAAAYSITGYIGQWIKVHYPIEFWSTAFAFANDDDYANYISEIYKTGNIKVVPVNINKSRNDVFTDFGNNAIYWPITSIKQCGDKAAFQLIEERDKNGQYFSFEEFLSRHNFKGSKINKRVIENLIISGAFDSIENIICPKERYKILEQYYEIKKIKHGDVFLLACKNKEDWWWTLQQKNISGIAFFDYNTVIEDNLNSRYDVIEVEELQEANILKHNVRIGGYLTEFNEHNSKKGKWCRLVLENNYNFFNVTIWAEEYAKLKELDLQTKEKCLILLSGEVVFSEFEDKRIIQATKSSEVIILE